MTKNMVRLGDICTVVSGSTPKTSVSEYWDGDIKWITPAELNEDSFYLHDSVRHITELGKEKTGLSYMPTGTVILSSRAPIGKTAIAACEMCCNQGFKNLICSDKIFNEYLYFFLSAKTEYLNSLGRGATFKEISKAIVENIMIPLPGIEDQKQIAARFVQIEDLIRLRKEQLQQLDQLVKSRFIELFGAIPDSKHTTVTDVCSIITDGTHQPPKFTSSGIPFLFVSNIVTNKITYKTEKHISEETYAELIKRTPIEIGDILLSTVGSYGHPAVVETDERFCFQRHIAYLKPKKDVVNSRYLYGVLLSADVQKQIEEKVKGIAQKTLNLSEIKKLHFPLPSLELQNEFAAFVEHTDKLKFAVQNAVYLQITLILNLVNHPWEHWASVSNKGVKL